MFKTREITLIGIFVAVLSILSQVSIPTPILVPINLGLFGVFLIGTLLRRRLAVMSILIYLALGAIGVPVFSNFGAGIGHIFGPKGGFLWGYLLSVLFISFFEEKMGKNINRKTYILRHIFIYFWATIITYFVGSIWLGLVTETKIYTSFISVFTGFILIDFVKIMFASFVVYDLRNILNFTHN